MTTDQVAKLFGTDKITAYGLLRFMATVKCIKTSKAPKAPGQRGRDTIVYDLNAGAIDSMRDLFLQMIAVTPATEKAT